MYSNTARAEAANMRSQLLQEQTAWFSHLGETKERKQEQFQHG